MADLSLPFFNRREARVRALWRLVLHTAALIVVGLLTTLVAQLVLASFGGEADAGPSTLTQPVVAALSAFAVVLATWVCARGLDHRSPRDFGLKLDRRWYGDLAFGLGLGVGLMAVIFAVELAAGWLTIEGTFAAGASGSAAGGLVAALVAFGLIGFYEELLSRGYHLRNLAEGLHTPRIGPAVALVVATVLSSSLFGLLHAGNPNATLISTVNVALAGCMLACGLLWTGQLAVPIGLHISWNFCQGNLFGFPVSGTDAGARVFVVEQGGDPLITGGAFGPEAGLIGVAAMVLGVAAIALWVRVTRGRLRLDRSLADAPRRS